MKKIKHQRKFFLFQMFFSIQIVEQILVLHLSTFVQITNNQA